MIVPRSFPPGGSGGLGCGKGCGCKSCGLGDSTSTMSSLISTLTNTVTIGSMNIPVWGLVALGVFAVAGMSKGK